MVNFFQTIVNSAQERSHAQYPLPFFLNQAAHLLKEGHMYWWSFKYYQMAQQAAQREAMHQGNPLVYGAAAYGLAQHFTLANCLVRMSLIAKCADDLFHSYGRVHHAYQKLSEVFQVKYPVYYRQQWLPPKQHLMTTISPSLYLELNLLQIKFTQRLIKIVKCTAQLITQVFQLSLTLRDTYLIATQDSIAQYTACSEVFANWDHYQRRLGHDWRFLLNELKTRQRWVNCLIGKLELIQQASPFVSTFKSAFEELTRSTFRGIPSFPGLGEFFEPLFNQGKVTPLSFSFEKEFKPSLPAVRYPPWNGQRLKPKKITHFPTKQLNQKNSHQSPDAQPSYLGQIKTYLNSSAFGFFEKFQETFFKFDLPKN